MDKLPLCAVALGAGYCSDSDQGDFTESDDEGEDGYRKGGSTAGAVLFVYAKRWDNVFRNNLFMALRTRRSDFGRDSIH